MKNMLLTILLFAFLLPGKTFAKESAMSLRLQMTHYNNTKKSWEPESEKIRTYLVQESQKYGYNFSLMDEATLKQFIQYQKRYLMIQEILVSDLSKIYFERYSDGLKDIKQNNSVKSIYGRRCTVWEKIAGFCEKKQKFFVHEAKYLNQKIKKMEMLESSLNYAITDLIVDDDKTAAIIFQPHRGLNYKMNYKMN
jgi:hypothetical protein